MSELLRGEYPGPKGLYRWGYTDDAVVRHGVLHDAAHFLKKPLTPAALARKVRGVMDRPPPAS